MNVNPSSDVSKGTPSHFQIQYHLICIDGRRSDDQWKLKIGLRAEQGWVTPANSFLQRLWKIDIPVKPAATNLLMAGLDHWHR